jgi:ClpA/ClpB-like protein
MFERYTEKARRTIFFARYEASQFGSHYIETEHLLLGLLREDKALAHRFLGTTSSESIRKQVEAHTVRREKVSTSVDMPLSRESKRVLAYGVEEAARLKHEHIGTEHMLLGLLREEKSLAAMILREHGLELSTVSEAVASGIGAPRESVHSALRARIGEYLAAHQKEWGIGVRSARDIRVYREASAQPTPADLPFLCIELLSGADRFAELIARIEDYLVQGVRYIWLLDPVVRRTYVVTAETGLREFKGRVLKTENPAIEMPLDEIFS